MTSTSWIMKAIPGWIGGAFNALGIMAVLGILCHTTGDPRSLSGQVMMWAAVIIWTLESSLCFALPSAWHGWLLFGGSALFFWFLFFCLRLGGL